MYERFYGLRERPFDLTPNPRYLLLTAKHREALSNVRYGISGRKGVTLLIGEAGTGKTTLVRAALTALPDEDVRCVYLNNPTLTRDEFLEYLAAGFGLPPDPERSKARFLIGLTKLLMSRQEAGAITALVVDEAQSLPHELLEEIRLLANIETSTEKLLPVVLAGQPELADRLNETPLRQLKQRVALRCQLDPFDFRETAAYIAGRIRIAGGDSASLFTRDAVTEIYDRSNGIPRTISVICDNALVSGFAAEQKPVGRDLILEVCKDFDLPGGGGRIMEPTPTQPAAAAPKSAAAVGPEVEKPVLAEPAAAAPLAPAASGDAPPAKAERKLFGHFTQRRKFSFF